MRAPPPLDKRTSSGVAAGARPDAPGVATAIPLFLSRRTRKSSFDANTLCVRTAASSATAAAASAGGVNRRRTAETSALQSAIARVEQRARVSVADQAQREREGSTKLQCDLFDTGIAVDISPCGEYFAAGGNGRIAFVFSTATGKEVARVPLKALVSSLHFTHGPRTSPDEVEDGRAPPPSPPPPPLGKYASRASEPGLGGLRMVSRGFSLNRILAQTPAPAPAPDVHATSTDGIHLLASGGADGVAELRGRSLKLLVGTYSCPGDAPNLQLVDVHSGVPLAATVHGGRDGKSTDILSSAVSRDGALVAAAGVSSEVVVYSVELSAAGQAAAGAGGGGGGAEPLLAGAHAFTPRLRIASSCTQVEAISLAADGGLLAVGGDARVVQLWTIARPSARAPDVGYSARLAYQFDCHNAIFALALSANGQLVAAGTAKRTEVWRVRASPSAPPPADASAERRKEWARFGRREGRAPMHSSAASRATEQLNELVRLAAASLPLDDGGSDDDDDDEPAPALWPSQGALVLEEGAPLLSPLEAALPASRRRFRRLARLHHRVDCEPHLVLPYPAPQGAVGFSEDCARLIIGGNRCVSLHDVASGTVLRSTAREGRVRCVALSATGAALVSAGFDRKVTFLSADAGCDIDEAPSRLETVRTVCQEGALLAIGGSSGQAGGLAQLFDMSGGGSAAAPVGEWAREREVRCVRLAPSTELLAIAGHDCIVALACTKTYAILRAVDYALPGGPPHFVWSVEFSLDGAVMAVGCWSKRVHVYALAVAQAEAGADADADADDAPAPADRSSGAGRGQPRRPARTSSQGSALGARRPRSSLARGQVPFMPALSLLARRKVELRELCTLERPDRVYAVSLDGRGRRLLVAGRDKKAALYDISAVLAAALAPPPPADAPPPPADAPPPPAPVLLWEAEGGDFLYACSLARNFSIAAWGGMGKSVHVVAAPSGAPICEIAVPGSVHCVAVSPCGAMIAVSGELPTLSVYSWRGRELFCLPQRAEVFGVSLSYSSLAFTKPHGGVLYGRAGGGLGWQDQPSFEMAARVLKSSSDEYLVRYLRSVLASHPSVATTRASHGGASLLQALVEESRDSELLELVLGSSTRIGLLHDANLTTALHAAVEGGNRAAMKALLRAELAGRLSRAPDSMRQIFSCFELIAARYPVDFLDYIAAVQLEPEPELLHSEEDKFADLAIPRMLVKGSYYRYPLHFWDKRLERYRVAPEGRLSTYDDDEDDDGFDEGGEEESGVEEEEARSSTAHSPRASVRTIRNSDATDSGRLGEARRSVRRAVDPDPEGEVRRSSSVPLGQQLDTNPLACRREPWIDPGINESLARVGAHGLRPMRVPFPQFAGAGLKQARAGVSPLQLVSKAVRATGDYKVFGSTLVLAAVQHKWETFARRQFAQSFCFFATHLAAIYVQVFVVLFPPEANGAPNPLIGLSWADFAAHPSFNLAVAMWVATSAFCVHDEYREFRRVHATRGLWEVANQVQIVLQMLSNALFVAALFVDAPALPDAFFRLISFNGADGDRDGRRRLAGRGSTTGGTVSVGALSAFEAFNAETTWVELIAVCEALVLLCAHVRLLYFARGFEALGVLIRMILQIIEDMLGFLAVLGLVMTGFGMALYVLNRHRYVFGQASVTAAITGIVDSGLYAAVADDRYSTGGVVQVLIQFVFLLLVQIVLLNLLIAIMSDSYVKVRTQAELAAKYELAQVVIETEVSPPFFERALAHFARRSHIVHTKKFPRWLHVLLPSATSTLNQSTDERDASAKPLKPVELGAPVGASGFNDADPPAPGPPPLADIKVAPRPASLTTVAAGLWSRSRMMMAAAQAQHSC